MPNQNGGDDGIQRKDTLDGTTLAAGGAAVATSSPMVAASAPNINADPRAMRGGNLPSTFDIGHLMRDRRLSFTANTVTIAPSPRDQLGGSAPLQVDNGAYDVIIVGGGM